MIVLSFLARCDAIVVVVVVTLHLLIGIHLIYILYSINLDILETLKASLYGNAQCCPTRKVVLWDFFLIIGRC